MAELTTLLPGGVFAFMIVFARVGAALMLLPGIGDMTTPAQVRLLLALGLTLAIAPALSGSLPPAPAQPVALVTVVLSEFAIGIFFGMLARLMISALEIGGMVVAHQIGLANAFALNPSMATQGSIPGAVLGMTGILLIFATDMHHLLLRSLVQTYTLFPAGSPPPIGDMADTITRFAGHTFLVGVELAAPFIVVGLVLFTGVGLLGRLMPQIQFFMIITPLQITLGLLLFAATLSGVMLFWLSRFESSLVGFLQNG